MGGGLSALAVSRLSGVAIVNVHRQDSISDGMHIDLGRVAHTVTKALDYVGIDDQSHGRRVGLMTHRVAHELGWDREMRHFALIAGMIHDCGVSSTAAHQKLVDEIEWKGAGEHCLRGGDFLDGFPPFAQYAGAVRFHHTRWNELPDWLDESTGRVANLIFLTDRLDVVRSAYLSTHHAYEVLRHRDQIVAKLAPLSGSLFAPDLFDALNQAILRDSFWLETEDEFLDSAIFETLSFWDHSMILGFDDLLALGEMISQIVDAKSPFTHDHSLRVADLTYAVTNMLGFSPRRRQMLRLAALLHDIGKLRTPDEILEKPGALTETERDIMLRHPMDSKMVLAALFPGTPIGRWASNHHEKLDGSGYPFGWSGDQIDEETRVLTICDIFQALCQKRPYRGRLRADEVVAIMRKMVEAGEIDPTIFRIVAANQDELYKTATREGR